MATSITDIPREVGQTDYFGIEKYEKGLVKFIQGSATPLTIALQGEWGSGKTSLMNSLRESLCTKDEEIAEGKYYGVWINAWEYAMMSTPEYTVLKIMERLIDVLSGDDDKPKSTFSNFMKKAGNFIWRGTRETLKTIPAVGGIAAVGIEACNIPNQVFNEDDTKKEQNVNLGDLRRSIEEAVDKIKQKNKYGVMVFVDDLDRINPKMAVELLELLKNVFQIKGCLFVLAIDYNVVVKGLSEKFGVKDKDNEREFRSFFDKIIQVPFAMPINRYNGSGFLHEKLHDLGFLEEGIIKQYASDINSVCDNTVGRNPRSIIRLLNTLSLINCVNSSDEKKEASKEIENLKKIVTFCLIALQVEYPKIYSMIETSPDFTKWEREMKERFCIDDSEDDNEGNIDYSYIIDSVCKDDDYLSRKVSSILDVLQTITRVISDAKSSTDILCDVMKQASVTSVGNSNENETQKGVIYRIYDNIRYFVSQEGGTLRRNTGCGGINYKGRYVVFYVNIEQTGIKLRIDFRQVDNPTEEFVGILNKLATTNPTVYKVKIPNSEDGDKTMWLDIHMSSSNALVESSQIENMKSVLKAWFEMVKG